jgi:hypothetical protein
MEPTAAAFFPSNQRPAPPSVETVELDFDSLTIKDEPLDAAAARARLHAWDQIAEMRTAQSEVSVQTREAWSSVAWKQLLSIALTRKHWLIAVRSGAKPAWQGVGLFEALLQSRSLWDWLVRMQGVEAETLRGDIEADVAQFYTMMPKAFEPPADPNRLPPGLGYVDEPWVHPVPRRTAGDAGQSASVYAPLPQFEWQPCPSPLGAGPPTGWSPHAGATMPPQPSPMGVMGLVDDSYPPPFLLPPAFRSHQA